MQLFCGIRTSQIESNLF